MRLQGRLGHSLLSASVRASAVGSHKLSTFQSLCVRASSRHPARLSVTVLQLFTKRAAAVLYGNQRLQRWCFDVELIYLADVLSIPITEVSDAWDLHDKPVRELACVRKQRP